MIHSNGAGFYAGLNVGVTNTASYPSFNSTVSSGTPTTVSSAGLGFSLNAGYAFNQYFATELEYMGMSSYSEQASASTMGITLYSYDITDSNSYLTLSAKGILPLNERFNLFGKVGAGVNFASISGNASSIVSAPVNINNSSNNFAYLVGIGAEFNVTKNVKLNLSDTYYMNNAPITTNASATSSSFGFGNTNLLSIGVGYYF